ncbi:MAG: hypothetical protein ACYDCS_09230 [Candidatus Dormibacteria bacterium]
MVAVLLIKAERPRPTAPLAIACIGVAYAALAIFAYSFVTNGVAARLPALGVPIMSFTLSQVLIPRIRFSSDHLGAKNWATSLFALQLVVVPLLIIFEGIGRGSLPALPSDAYINAALLLQTVAFLSYAVGIVVAERFHVRLPAAPVMAVARRIPGWLVGGTLAIGTAGLFLRFQNLSNLLDYFSGSSPIAYGLIVGQATTAQSVSTFLLPFLGGGFALIGCRAADAWRHKPVRRALQVLTAVVVLAALATSYAVYGYNRGTVVIAILAMIATFSLRWRRVPMPLLAALAVLLIWGFLAAGSFRSSYQLTQEGAYNSAATSPDPGQTIEVYAQGPQFLGYLLENAPGGDSLLWGGSIAASALAPVPALGRAFRTTSGSAIYNKMIYGTSLVADQIIPFEGELFLNFSIPGVLLGFALLGAAIAALDRRAKTAKSSYGTYAAQYVGLWTGFLVIGSVGVLSQVLLYLCAPILLILWVSRWGASQN